MIIKHFGAIPRPTRVLEDTPAVRGMANKISHLVRIEDVE